MKDELNTAYLRQIRTVMVLAVIVLALFVLKATSEVTLPVAFALFLRNEFEPAVTILTTAAGLWAAAAVGLAIGIGFYEAAALGGCAIYVVLTVMHRWDDRMHRNSKIMEIYVELSTVVTLGSFIRGVRELGLEIDNLQLDHTEPAEDGIRSFIVTLKSRLKRNHQQLLGNIRAVDGVVYLEEL